MVVDSNAMPVVVDWNEDGRKDLVIGEEKYPQTTGSIRLYLNSGTNSNPVFSTYSYILGGGVPIYQYRANPTVCDLDADGKKDLVVGNNDGIVLYYCNFGTNASPVFNARPDTLKMTTGTIIDAYYGSRVNFVDWKGDGDLDLLISGYYGNMEYYESNRIIGVAEQTPGRPGNSVFAATPNPAAQRVSFHYHLSRGGRVTIEIYNVDGSLAALAYDGVQNAGAHVQPFDLHNHSGRRLPSGIYFARLNAGLTSLSSRLVVLD